jgi:enoyl-CoA hydratase/carnithine racemase
MSDIEVSVEDHVGIVTLNRPQRRNAMTLAMWHELARSFAGFAADPAVRGVILTGAGEHFCAGADIAEFASLRDTVEQGHAYDKAVDDCCDAIAALAKPTIAAVRGFCMGGGSGLAMACDFRIAEPGAVFGIPAARLSIVYGMRETQNLLALVGLANAKRILFSAERFGTEEALRIGFIDRIAPDPVAAAKEFAAVMAKNAPLTIAGSKAILTGLAMGEGALDPEDARRLVEAAFLSEDYREGQRAFLEKRQPAFKGR